MQEHEYDWTKLSQDQDFLNELKKEEEQRENQMEKEYKFMDRVLKLQEKYNTTRHQNRIRQFIRLQMGI
jgi:hypothetical protein